VEESKQISVPEYYYSAAQWINQQEDEFRIFDIPEMRWAIYLWDNQTKFGGTDVAMSLIRKPFIGRQYYHAVGSYELDSIVHRAYELIEQNETYSLANVMTYLNAKYILVHLDFMWELYNNVPPSYILSVLNETPNLTLDRRFGLLYFYRNLAWKDMGVYLAEEAPRSNPNLTERFEVIPDILPYLRGVVVQASSPTSYSMTIDLLHPGYLVLNQAYDERWAVLVDGIENKDHSVANGYANAWFISRPGSHQVIIFYRHFTFAWFSLITASLFLGALLSAFASRKMRLRRGQSR
jgi:hypothetical protein